MNTENNKLIVEFMGASPNNGGEYDITSVTPDRYSVNPFLPKLCFISEMQFHVSWDWLMPVVEKIESVGGDVAIYFKTTCIRHTYLANELSHESKSKIEAAYKAVVEFIKWYNSQPK